MAWAWGLRPVITVLRSWSRRIAVTSRPAWLIAWNLVLQATQNTRKKNLVNTTTNHKFSIQNSSLQYGASSLPRSRLHLYSSKPCFLVQCSASSGEPKSLGAVLLGAVTHSFLSLFLYWLLSFREKVNRKRGEGQVERELKARLVVYTRLAVPKPVRIQWSLPALRGLFPRPYRAFLKLPTYWILCSYNLREVFLRHPVLRIHFLTSLGQEQLNKAFIRTQISILLLLPQRE